MSEWLPFSDDGLIEATVAGDKGSAVGRQVRG